MVVFVNKLRLQGTPEELEEIYAGVAAYFATQPGFLDYRLVRSQDDPAVYFNIATWTDETAFRAATGRPEFRSAVRVGKVSTGDPHLCTVVAAHAG